MISAFPGTPRRVWEGATEQQGKHSPRNARRCETPDLPSAQKRPGDLPGTRVPGYPANYLATANMKTGAFTKVPLSGPVLEPQGMIFVPAF